MQKFNFNHQSVPFDSHSTGERRLCFLGGHSEYVDENRYEGINVDRSAENRAIIDKTNSAFFFEAMQLWEKHSGADQPSATPDSGIVDATVDAARGAVGVPARIERHETGWWKRDVRPALGIDDTDKFPKSVYTQFIDEEAWLAVFEDPTKRLAAAAVPRHAVHLFWHKLGAGERHKLFEAYMRENLEGAASLDPTLNKIETSGYTDVRSYGKLLKLRRNQVEGKNKPEVDAILNLRYKEGGDLLAAAHMDLRVMVFRDENLREELRALNPETVTKEELKSKLPHSSLWGALHLNIINDTDARDIVVLFQEQDMERIIGTGEQKEQLLKLRKNTGAIIEKNKDKSPEYISDQVWAQWDKLGNGQKLVIGSLVVYMGYRAITNLFGSRQSHWLSKPVALATVVGLAGLFGGEKVIRGFMDDKEKKNEEDDSVRQRSQPDEEDKAGMALIEHMDRYLYEHGENERLDEILALNIMGKIPLKHLAAHFNPDPDGRSGTLDFYDGDDLDNYLKKELMNNRDINDSRAEAVIDHMKGRRWGNPLAHIFYAYGYLGNEGLDSTVRNANQLIHMNTVLKSVKNLSVDTGDPLDVIANFDAIEDGTHARRKYIEIMHIGRQAAETCEMSMADFIVTITPRLQNILGEIRERPRVPVGGAVPPGGPAGGPPDADDPLGPADADDPILPPIADDPLDTPDADPPLDPPVADPPLDPPAGPDADPPLDTPDADPPLDPPAGPDADPPLDTPD
ncbi:hypothetical protein KJ652_01370, partial [Patescibacteria group bacterium]|nr:hypothetical protein [Patescibacteria group bacterium]